MVTSLGIDITYEGLRCEMRDICKFDELQPFTMKWVDEEGEDFWDSLHSKVIQVYTATSLWIQLCEGIRNFQATADSVSYIYKPVTQVFF